MFGSDASFGFGEASTGILGRSRGSRVESGYMNVRPNDNPITLLSKIGDALPYLDSGGDGQRGELWQRVRGDAEHVFGA